MTNQLDNHRFQALLERWNSHQSLRQAHAPIATLAISREKLDDARLDVRRAA